MTIDVAVSGRSDDVTATTGAPLVRPGTAWIVLGVGVLAYVLTVMQRTTFGVAGIDAAARFEVSPGALSMFVFIQVSVYVTLQIPAGLLVDRWGSRTMIVSQRATAGGRSTALGLRVGYRHRDPGPRVGRVRATPWHSSPSWR